KERGRKRGWVSDGSPGACSPDLGVGAPKNTPAAIVAKLNEEINAALADPKVKERLADLGGVPMPMTPADFGTFIVEETEKWAKEIGRESCREKERSE